MRTKINTLRRSFIGFWRSDSGLSAFLVLLILNSFVFPPLILEWKFGYILGSLSLSLLLLAGIIAASERYFLMISISFLTFLAVVLHWASILIPSKIIIAWSLLFTLATFVMMTYTIVIQVFRDGPINIHRIQGSIAIYLLLGTIWANAYTLLALFYPDAFAGAIHFDSSIRMETWIYFSYSTLTTVGYGDITPIHPIGRSLAMMEALVGQLFPAILISRLVSQEIQERSKNN